LIGSTQPVVAITWVGGSFGAEEEEEEDEDGEPGGDASAANNDAGEEAVEPPPDADSGVSGVRSSAPIAALYSLQLETISVSILAKLRLLLFGLFTVLLDPPMWNLDLSPHCVISAASPR
jgi:hypothetical protein